MNPEFSSMSSSTIESIRKAGIGRRGGVKVRGGRLPPVKIHNVLSKKKTIAPKIPQKRSEVKKEKDERESFDELPFRGENKFRGQPERGRGRGRGARVYIQTEGTLFGEGIGFKPKSERNFASYERSVPRSKVYIKKKERVDPEGIGFLLESYNDSEEDSDTEYDLKPIKYPILKEKQEIKQEIKHEIKQEVKQEIKTEVEFDVMNLTIEDVRQFIKAEPIDDYETKVEETPKPAVSQFFTPIEAATFSAKNELFTELNSLENDKGIMLLMQFPSCFPYDKQGDNLLLTESKKRQPLSAAKDDGNQDDEIRVKSSIRDIPEGFIGKLQFLKSGKMRLVLGSTQFYLESGSARHIQANAVSISIKGKEGEIAVLGKIDRKMLFRPHFNGLTG